MIEIEKKGKRSWSEISYKIVRVDENHRGENFDVVIAEDQTSAASKINKEFYDIVVCKLKSEFSLN